MCSDGCKTGYFSLASVKQEVVPTGVTFRHASVPPGPAQMWSIATVVDRYVYRAQTFSCEQKRNGYVRLDVSFEDAV
jgi:hypothetical protein